ARAAGRGRGCPAPCRGGLGWAGPAGRGRACPGAPTTGAVRRRAHRFAGFGERRSCARRAAGSIWRVRRGGVGGHPREPRRRALCPAGRHPRRQAARPAGSLDMIAAIRLGLRLAGAGIAAGPGRVRSVLVGLAGMVGTIVMLVVLAIAHAESGRSNHGLVSEHGMSLLLITVVVTVGLPVLVLAATAG